MRFDTADSIFNTVATLLSSVEGRRQSQRLTQYLEHLTREDVKKELAHIVERARAREGTVFHSAVGDLKDFDPKRPEGRIQIDVRIRGRSCGTLTVASRGTRTFSPKPKGFAGCQVVEAGTEWAHGSVLAFLRDADARIGRSHEREAEIESALLAQMRDRRSPSKPRQLHNHQPVRLAGLPFQFPVPIRARGGVRLLKGSALGHCDIVARHGGRRVRVFEVKRPGEADSRDALSQAVAYCSALQILLDREPQVYRSALGFSPKAPINRIDAAAFVHKRYRKQMEQELERLDGANAHVDLFAYLYEVEGNGLNIVERLERPSPGRA